MRLCVHLGKGLGLASALRLRHGRDWHITGRGMRTIQRWMDQALRVIGVRVHGYGEPLSAQSVLLVANHISFLDIIVISAFTPARFLSKDTVRYWPLVGQLSQMSGTLFIQRGRRSAISQVLSELKQALRHPRPVVIFPEGTTSLGESVLRFHRGLLQSAVETEVPVQPVALRYLRDGRPDRHAAYIDNDNFVLNLLRLMSLPGSEVHVHFTEPLDSRRHGRQALAQLAHARICEIVAPHAMDLPPN